MLLGRRTPVLGLCKIKKDKMKFSIIVDCDHDGRITIWAQQKENLSPKDMDKLTRMLLSIKRSVGQETIENSLPFPETINKKAS
jgi:hypothetical protein